MNDDEFDPMGCEVDDLTMYPWWHDTESGEVNWWMPQIEGDNESVALFSLTEVKGWTNKDYACYLFFPQQGNMPEKVWAKFSQRLMLHI